MLPTDAPVETLLPRLVSSTHSGIPAVMIDGTDRMKLPEPLVSIWAYTVAAQLVSRTLTPAKPASLPLRTPSLGVPLPAPLSLKTRPLTLGLVTGVFV